MTNLIKKAKKLIISLALAGVAVFGAFASACTIETKHPEAEIVLELYSEGETVASVTLKYTLHRDIHPVTVRHFTELADEGFYDNTIIHNYATSDWFTGGYAYDADTYESNADANTMRNYLDETCKESKYFELAKTLTPSVYRYIYEEDGKQFIKTEDALPYLMGEYSSNIQQEIENDICIDAFGCLKMYYYGKEFKEQVYVTPPHDDRIITADYKNNCATSLFMLQVSNSSSYRASNYSVFALLENPDDLTKFLDEVDEYIDGLSTKTVSAEVNVDNLETFSKDEADRNIETNFTLPTVPLVVKSVKITKY